ncbi:DNA primase small subunit domain-containing protein [Nanoarchaeota archaeon]
MLNISTTLLFYKRPEIQKAIVAAAKNKEIAVKFGDNGFGKRPDSLHYPNDVLEFAKQGATSFHASEELWHNPLQINTSLKKQEMDDLRIGWDLMLDIDCPVLEYSSIAADLIVKALQYHDINAVSIKFSGNHGFHIAVPFESFPETITGNEARLLFPEGPKRVALYLQEMIRKKLAKALLDKEEVTEIIKKTGKEFNEVVKNNIFDPFKVLAIDTILISSRHLYRMPYSFNEKSGLVSVPVDPNKILEFDKESAKPEKVEVNKYKFLDREKAKSGEAKSLLINAYDFEVKEDVKEKERREKIFSSDSAEKQHKEFAQIQNAIPEELFPPCIKNILKGLQDGKKRSMFILINFLTTCGWSYEKIEELMKQWNEKNPEPLRENLIVGQLRYHKQHKKKILPPNCDNDMYYKGMQICTPDSYCNYVKNPANYAIKKIRGINREKKKEEDKLNKPKAKREPLTEEQKEARRKFRKMKKEKEKELKEEKELSKVSNS